MDSKTNLNVPLWAFPDRERGPSPMRRSTERARVTAQAWSRSASPRRSRGASARVADMLATVARRLGNFSAAGRRATSEPQS